VKGDKNAGEFIPSARVIRGPKATFRMWKREESARVTEMREKGMQSLGSGGPEARGKGSTGKVS